MSKAGSKARVAANGYRLCDSLPEGYLVRDEVNKVTWIVGKKIGQGGFGEICLCVREDKKKETFVMKLDNASGPLFAEMNFYHRVAKEEAMKEFILKQKLTRLGMPKLISTGVFSTKNEISNKSPNKKRSQSTSSVASNNSKKNKSAPTSEYRFLVMPRFGCDLERIINDGKMNINMACEIACQMIDVLHYIHSYGYIHGDIKATNILQSFSSSKQNEFYLVDFGLVERFMASGPSGTNQVHREEKPDKKRANNGTVEYRSRDAHQGMISRRSDMECLAYNVLHWLSGSLPWLEMIADANRVEKSKNKLMNDLHKELDACFSKTNSQHIKPTGLEEFMTAIARMPFSQEPDYAGLKKMINQMKIKKTTTTTPPASKVSARSAIGKSPAKKLRGNSDGQEESVTKVNSTKQSTNNNTLKKNGTSKSAPVVRKSPVKKKAQSLNATIIISDSEDEIKEEQHSVFEDCESEDEIEDGHDDDDKRMNQGMTPAMLQVKKMLENKKKITSKAVPTKRKLKK